MGLIPISTKIFAAGAVDDVDLCFWTVCPIDPIFVEARLDIADRIGLRTGRPLVTAVAQTSDISITVLASLANIPLCHPIFLSLGSFLISWAGHCCPAPSLLLVWTLSQRRCCCCFCSLARIGIAQHFRCRRSRLLACHFRIAFLACHFIHLLSY